MNTAIGDALEGIPPSLCWLVDHLSGFCDMKITPIDSYKKGLGYAYYIRLTVDSVDPTVLLDLLYAWRKDLYPRDVVLYDGCMSAEHIKGGAEARFNIISTIPVTRDLPTWVVGRCSSLGESNEGS